MKRVAICLAVVGACSLPELPPLDPCLHVADTASGTYCGSSAANGFVPTDDPDQLVTCVGQREVAVTTCANRCVLSSGADRCDPDPCAAAVGHDGVYCGASMQYGFAPSSASPYFLYTCTAGATAGDPQFCAHGCMTGAAGSDDTCTP